ncbi:UDP-N-acetylmuramoyl-L-alanyl-D-glutamate--2,6-diaminopimelate ligase [Candidatus Uhrbacteria bacterium]|nr:UDP-N-acetylmuramoyl-L-alanyl-D-glutamate--2,6-diaminopimelate ligase [Candidatus Uhrbacteria bacterium]
MKSLLKKILPAKVFDYYHRALAHLAAIVYRRPSEKMIVIGVTGTNGKSTTCNFIAAVLEEAGFKVGLATTVNFRIAGKDRLNDTKMTMLGRFALQRMLAEMVRAGCRYAIVETSSEGIRQHRHLGIHYDAAVFTNLTPEHVESHGGFENYKKAKGELFAKLADDPIKRLPGSDGRGRRDVKKAIVANLASPHAGYFLDFRVNKKYGFYLEPADKRGEPQLAVWPLAIVKALDADMRPAGSTFAVRDTRFSLAMPGAFNVENALAAIAIGLSQGIALPVMANALAKITGVPGRLERIDEGQPFTVIVDYAPEPESFRKLYEVVALLPKKRVIHVLGSTGGGRDVSRRPILGRLAAQNADVVIVTNEDPYDDDPARIIADVARGAAEHGKIEGQDLFLILDRGQAIDKAVALAQPGDLVLITGKGSEQAMVVAGGRKIPWDDRVKAREALKKRP